MTPSLDCIVLGTPAPQGSKRAVPIRGGGHVRVIESSKKVKPWREAIVAQVRHVWHTGPIIGAVYVGVEFYLQRPRSHYRANGELRENAPEFSTTRPDGDKLLRSTLDGLKTAGVYRDDSQVAVIVAEKRYIDSAHATPGARIVVDTLAASSRVWKIA